MFKHEVWICQFLDCWTVESLIPILSHHDAWISRSQYFLFRDHTGTIFFQTGTIFSQTGTIVSQTGTIFSQTSRSDNPNFILFMGQTGTAWARLAVLDHLGSLSSSPLINNLDTCFCVFVYCSICVFQYLCIFIFVYFHICVFSYLCISVFVYLATYDLSRPLRQRAIWTHGAAGSLIRWTPGKRRICQK